MADDKNDQKFLNKREYARIELHDPIRLIKDKHSYDEYLGDISKTGCKVFSIDEMRVGEKVEVGIKDPKSGEYFNLKGEIKRSITLKDEEAQKLGTGSIYKCFTCKYTAQKLELEGQIKWQTIDSPNQHIEVEKELPHYDYLQRTEGHEWIYCPVCYSDSFMVTEGDFFELGIHFTELTKELNETIERVISNAIEFEHPGKRDDSRMDGQYLPVDLQQTFGKGVDLYHAYLMDFSRGGAKVILEHEYNIGQDINLKLGLEEEDPFEVPAHIVHKKKTKNGFEYGLKFKFFDKSIQAELNHFIDELALGDYKAHHKSRKQKQIVLSSSAWGIGGYAGGFISAFLIMGGFYIFSGYSLTKQQKTITVSEGGKQYNLELGKVFKGQTKGLPKKLVKKIRTAQSKCKKAGSIDKKCFESELTKFAKVIEVPQVSVGELEKSILDKRENIQSSDMEEFYMNLKNKNLPEAEMKIRMQEFKLKVKRAIQMPKGNN